MGEYRFVNHIEGARESASREAAWMEDEMRACKRLYRDVSQMDPVEEEASTAVQAPQASIQRQDPSGLSTVTKAYRETIMNLSHFEKAYDAETAEEGLKEQFGPYVAGMVEQSNAITTEIKTLLTQSISESYHGSKLLRNQAVAEQEALEEAAGTIRDIEDGIQQYEWLSEKPVEQIVDPDTRVLFTGADYEALTDAYEDILDYREDCNELVEKRQDIVHGRVNFVSNDPWILDEILYEYRDVIHPVLKDATELNTYLQGAQQKVEKELMRWD